jgi:hypothetical protein
MHLKELSNYQLYEIIQNQKLDKNILKAANVEFNLRNLSSDEIQEIIIKHDSLYQPGKDEPLNIKYKMLALVVPFVWIVHLLMTSRYLARGQKRKWKEYWMFFCLGLLLWTIAIILIGRQWAKAG